LHANSTAQGPVTKLARVKVRNIHTQSTKQGELQHMSNDDVYKTVIITKLKVIIYEVMMLIIIIIIIMTK
jgi:hypothetical protein